jgi:hypothetical protein
VVEGQGEILEVAKLSLDGNSKVSEEKAETPKSKKSKQSSQV